MDNQGVSVVSNSAIMARADALEKAEKEAAAKAGEAGKIGDDDAAAKAAADKAAADAKEAADKKAAEDAAKAGKTSDGKTEDTAGKTPGKKVPNDPEELRKWNTRNAQENKKLRDELAAIKAEQEKTYKLLASLSKKEVDYKELAKNPDAIQRLVEEERESATAELQERLEQLTTEAKQKDTIVERMRRENDAENYPRWKELYPQIVKIAMGPTGAGDPRVDFTKPAGEVLDALYEIATNENPVSAAPAAPVSTEKVYKESEMKAMLADMLAKEKDAIAKSAKEEAIKEAQEALANEAKGGTVASAGKGAGRIPSDKLSAFKKMSLSEQRDWLIAQQNAQ
jgi:hypothetical protein